MAYSAFPVQGITDGDKGDLTVSSSGATYTVDNDAITYAKIQNISTTDRLLGRDTTGAGDIEELSVSGGVEFTGSGGIQRSALTGDVTATAGSNSTTISSSAITSKTEVTAVGADYILISDTSDSGNLKKALASDLAGAGGVSDGDKGDITVSGSGATWTIDSGVVSLAKMADMATSSVFYRKTAGTGAPEVQTLATLKTDLGLTGTNSGDQTSIVGITGTKSQFDTAVTDGNFLYVGDVTQYTDEMAQDAVGAMVDSSLVYTDGTPLLQRAALTGAVTATAGSNSTALGSFTKSELSTAVSDGDVLFVGDVTSNATHTGDVTGSTALTIDPTAITGKTTVTAVGADYVLISDTSDSGNLKKALVSDMTGSGGVSDGDKGDITVSASGATWTIDNGAVSYAKLQDASTGNVVLARAAGTSGDYSEVGLNASQLLGRGSTGDIANITLGTNLSMSGTTLNATGGGGGLTQGQAYAMQLGMALP